MGSLTSSKNLLKLILSNHPDDDTPKTESFGPYLPQVLYMLVPWYTVMGGSISPAALKEKKRMFT